MTRLRDEIVAARQGREALREDLRRDSGARHTEVQVWRAAFLEELAGVRRAWARLRSRSAMAPSPPPAETVEQGPAVVPPEAASRLAKEPPPVAPAAPHSHVPPAHPVVAETVAPAVAASHVPRVHPVVAETVAPAVSASHVPQVHPVVAE